MKGFFLNNRDDTMKNILKFFLCSSVFFSQCMHSVNADEQVAATALHVVPPAVVAGMVVGPLITVSEVIFYVSLSSAMTASILAAIYAGSCIRDVFRTKNNASIATLVERNQRLLKNIEDNSLNSNSIVAVQIMMFAGVRAEYGNNNPYLQNKDINEDIIKAGYLSAYLPILSQNKRMP